MSILDRILGRIPNTSPQITATALPRTPAAAASDSLPAVSMSIAMPQAPRPAAEGMIRVYDPFGRKVEIGREAWRREVLLPNLAANRDDPDSLHQLIIGALDDDFEADLLESARHLAERDPQPRRGALVLGVVLLKLGEYAAARETLERALERHGRDPYLLSNLARAHAALGDDESALRFIWQALEMDPNEETSLSWLVAVIQVKGGQEGVTAAYRRAASLPGSWRALLYLARFALEQGDVAEATRLYQEALARAGKAPADLLMQPSCS
jgi:tetratricopeptide (TPR) repeat protein